MKKKNNGFYSGDAAKTYAETANASDAHTNREDVERKVEDYAEMSEEDLLDELFAQAAAARRRGDLDDKKLNEFYRNIKGMLDPVQLKKLDVLMRALRSDRSR